MAFARSTDSSSIHGKWREGTMYGHGGSWKFSSDFFHFLSKAGVRTVHWMKIEEELETLGERRQHGIALSWQKEEFSAC